MPNQSLVSIILPVYNGQLFLADAINSVLSQTYNNIELLIVDDGSTDNSINIAKSFEEKDSRIRYFQQKNGGVAAARNTALRCIRGLFVGFIDQDDLWLTDKLETQMMYFNNNPEAVFLHGNIDYIDDDANTIDKNLYPWETNASGKCFGRLFNANAIAIQTVCFKSNCIDKIGLLREDVPGVDDYDYWLRFSRFFRIDYVDKTLALYRFHGANESHKWHLQDIKRTKVLEGILQKFPEVYDELGQLNINHKLYGLYHEIALEFIRKNDYVHARPYLLKAMQTSSISLDLLAKLLICYIPNKIRIIFSWYLYKLGISKK